MDYDLSGVLYCRRTMEAEGIYPPFNEPVYERRSPSPLFVVLAFPNSITGLL